MGALNGLFTSPMGLALDSSGDFIYIADPNNFQIQQFERFGLSLGAVPAFQVIVKNDVTSDALQVGRV